jgi:hypothetical protein
VLRILKFFDADLDPGSGIFLTLDPGSGMEKFESDIPDTPTLVMDGLDYSYKVIDDHISPLL